MNDTWDQIRTSIEAYAPQVLGAAVILVVGWLVASLIAWGVRRALHRSDLDERLARSLGAGDLSNTERSAGRAAFWVIMLLVVIAALETLEFHAVTQPLSDVVSTLLGFLPNLIAAAAILGIGYVIARVLRVVAENVSDAMGVNRIGARAGLASADAPRLSTTLGLIVFALVLIPTIVAALNALRIDAVAGPTSNMLDEMLAAVPGILAAVLLLVLAYLTARVVTPLVSNVLAGLGFNTIPARLGLDAEARFAGRTPAQVAGDLIFAAIMLLASLEAAELVGFLTLAALISRFLVYFGQILVGLAIIAIGFWLANLMASAIRTSGASQAPLLALIARVAVVVLAFAIGIGEMGIAEEIVILAFGLPLAAVALGVAIGLGVALGLGGREVAARELESIRESIRSSPSM